MNTTKKIKNNVTIIFVPPHLQLVFEITELFAKILIPKITNTDNKPVGQRILNIVFGRDIEFDVKDTNNITLTKKDYYIADLFKCGKEIYDSYQRMEMTISLSKKIGSHRGFKKNELLNYYNENFINEFYIFTERVIQLMILIEKKAEKLRLQKQYKVIVGLRKLYIDSYKPPRSLRNTHTHYRRHLDPNFERLDTMVMYKDFTKDKQLDSYYEYTYRTIKRDHIKQLQKALETLHDTADKFLKPLKKVLMNDILPKL